MRTFSIFSAALLAAASAGLVGCGAEVSGDPDGWDEVTGSEGVSEEGAPRTLAEVDVGYGTVVFQEAEGEEGSLNISVAEITANDAGSTPFSDIAGLGTYTMLELFRAVAPGQEAPQALVDAHEFEVQQLGRESSEVTIPEFDRDAPIEKVSQACRNFVTPPYGMCRYYSTTSEKDATSATSQYLGSSSFYTNGPVHQGLCNDSSQSIRAKMRRQFSGSLSWSTYEDVYVPAGQKVTSFTQFHWDPMARYRVFGTPLLPYYPASFSLRSGKLSPNRSLCPDAPPWLP